MAGYLSNHGTRLFDHSRCRPPPGDDLRTYAEHLGPWRKFVSPRCPAGDMCVASQRSVENDSPSARGAKATLAPEGAHGRRDRCRRSFVCPILQALSTIKFLFDRSQAELSSPCRITSFR